MTAPGNDDRSAADTRIARPPGQPPRPLAPGDIVAMYSDELGEWTAAQILSVDREGKQAGVLELDWSGPEPMTVADLGPARPLWHTYRNRPDHSSLEHCNYRWLLPRGFKVIGILPLLHTGSSNSYGWHWRNIGMHLVRQRRRDAGDYEPWYDPRSLELTGADLSWPEEPQPEIYTLVVKEAGLVDADRVVTSYPNLTTLSLHGNLGSLANAASLNELAALRILLIGSMFGMTATDCLLPERTPAMEWISLHNIPRDYAAAMRARWRPEIPRGTELWVSGARKPEWVAENLDNPLRDWDTREHISRARYAKAVARYKATRRAVLALLSEPGDHAEQLHALGREYGEAFNTLNQGRRFIETVEREELCDALEHVADAAGAGTEVGDSLIEGLDSVRCW